MSQIQLGVVVAIWGQTGWFRCPHCKQEHESRLRLLDGRIPAPGEVPVEGLYEHQVLVCYLCREPMKTAREMINEGSLIVRSLQ